ncbi:MAG: hypothetical protein WCH76_01070 [Candidatus Riflemargulisbacteria bacterium]
MTYKIVALMNDNIAKTREFLSEGIQYPSFKDNGLLSEMIKRFGLQSLYKDSLFQEVANMSKEAIASELKVAILAGLDEEYFQHISKNSLAIVVFAMRIMDKALESEGKPNLVFLGRGADLIYDASKLISAVVPRYRDLSDRIFLIDFTRRFPISLVNKHFSDHGMSLKDKLMLVDDYQSSVAASSTAINNAIREVGGSSARNHAMVSTEIVDGEEEYHDTNSVMLFSDLPFEFLKQVSLFLSSNGDDSKTYCSGRKLANVESLPVKYEYNYQYIRFMNKASLYYNAISLLFSDEIDFSKTFGVEKSVIDKIREKLTS